MLKLLLTSQITIVWSR